MSTPEPETGYLLDADPVFYARSPRMHIVRDGTHTGLVPVDSLGDKLLQRVRTWEKALVDSLFRHRKCARIGFYHRYEYERAFQTCIRKFGDREGIDGTATGEAPDESMVVTSVTVVVTKDRRICPVLRWGPSP